MISMIPGEAIDHIKQHVEKVAFRILDELKEIREDVRQLKADIAKQKIARKKKGE